MRHYQSPYIWKQIPFARLIIPFMIGIAAQWYLQLPAAIGFCTFLVSTCAAIGLSMINITWRYRLRWLQGNMINLSMAALGLLLTHQQDIRNRDAWLGHYYQDGAAMMVTLAEPLVEKAKTYKAEADVNYVQIDDGWKAVEGKIIIYLKKDSAIGSLGFNSRLLLANKLQPIKNSGNPGAFDYARYNAFRGIHHQVYVRPGEFRILPGVPPGWLDAILLSIKNYVLQVLKQNIAGEEESAVAEALLVGYKNDLDKDLLQAYSNTGVVHIIAISGLHLALIYGVLVWVLSPLKQNRFNNILKALIILCILWMFGLVAGAAPSIIRSAIMFSFILFGQLLGRKASIYNTLSGAAFVMLSYNPFNLWDVGFQLSFGAVLSIVIFMEPIYKWWYIRNKLLDNIWKLTSVTLSAQVLTFPIIIYYFHQFPLMFIISNFVAVPLSAIILKLELLLVLFSFYEPAAHHIGQLLHYGIWLLNSFIKNIDQLPNAVYDNIHVNLLQTYLLYGLIIAASFWLTRKWKPGLHLALVFILAFLAVDVYEKTGALSSAKMVVYNVPKRTAIDFIHTNQVQFVGDTAVAADPLLNNFHLKPARVAYRTEQHTTLTPLRFQKPFIYFHEKKILLLDKPLKFETSKKINVDVIVISNNPRIYIPKLHEAFNCSLYVFDASNPEWKIKLWKKDCDSLHLRHHSTPEQGAFVMEL
jgi:competence protein ComEC